MSAPDPVVGPLSFPVVADLLAAVAVALASVRAGDPWAAADLDALERAAARVEASK